MLLTTLHTLKKTTLRRNHTSVICDWWLDIKEKGKYFLCFFLVCVFWNGRNNFSCSFSYAIREIKLWKVFHFHSEEVLSDGFKWDYEERKTLFRFLDFMTGKFGKRSLAPMGERDGEKNIFICFRHDHAIRFPTALGLAQHFFLSPLPSLEVLLETGKIITERK